MSNVVAFRPRGRNGFTVRDRIEAHEWQAALLTRPGALARLDIHAEQPGDDGQEACDLLLLYRRDQRWASWGVARRDGQVGVWCCADGVDLGRFETMREALAAVLLADDSAARSRRARGAVGPATHDWNAVPNPGKDRSPSAHLNLSDEAKGTTLPFRVQGRALA